MYSPKKNVKIERTSLYGQNLGDAGGGHSFNIELYRWKNMNAENLGLLI